MKEITSKPRFTFNTVGLFTNNNKATVEFYTKAFGFTTSWDGVQPSFADVDKEYQNALDNNLCTCINNWEIRSQAPFFLKDCQDLH